MIPEPPNWRIAASNEKRVRVEFFWKIIASTRPSAGASASTLPCPQPLRAVLRALASSSIRRSVAPSSFQRSMKCRGWVIAIPSPLSPAKAGARIHPGKQRA